MYIHSVYDPSCEGVNGAFVKKSEQKNKEMMLDALCRLFEDLPASMLRHTDVGSPVLPSTYLTGTVRKKYRKNANR